MICWDDLKPFLAVARTGSTLAAAKSLGVNQTTVARRLSALEEALGTRLFDRVQSGARLTEAGRDLVSPAERVEAAMTALTEQMGARGRRLAGTVRVTTNETVANVIVTPAIAAFREAYPDIGVEMHVSDRHFDLRAGEADVAIRAGGRPTELDLVARRLTTTPWFVYAGRSYVARHGAPESVEALNDHQLIGCDGVLANLPGNAWLRRQAPRARTPCTCNNLANLFQVVRSGLGVAPLPRLGSEGDPELVRLFEVPDAREMAIWSIVHETLRDAPRVRAFVDFLAAHVKATAREPGPASTGT